MKPLLVAAVAAALALSSAHAETRDEAGKAWWSHIKFLAADELQGRLTGSPGEKAGLEYVAAKFKALGLQPAGTDGYFQPVAFKAQRVLADQSSAALVADGVATPLAVGPDLLLSARLPQPASVEAPLVTFGTPAQQRAYLPGMVSGDLIGAHGMTEAGSGSDALHMRTRAERH